MEEPHAQSHAERGVCRGAHCAADCTVFINNPKGKPVDMGDQPGGGPGSSKTVDVEDIKEELERE